MFSPALEPSSRTAGRKIQHFGSTTVDVDQDADGDGWSNREEYEAGTDPKTSVPVAATVNLSTGWNFIALPVVPPKTADLNTLLNGLPPAMHWWWAGWTQPYHSAGELKGKRGLAVHVPGAGTAVPVTGQSIADQSFLLFTGWNLVGSVSATFPPAARSLGNTIWWWNAGVVLRGSRSPGTAGAGARPLDFRRRGRHR